ncbi:MAG: VWA-like domain-containing protein, partial [Cellulosilyticum sp.]|nr:VWA-like domain-containing protein [Cellulosilyticum sp.]
AIDISGSISNEEFKQAMKEVFQIVKRYKHAVTIIECDEEIRRVYEVKSIKDLQNRFASQGGTLFTPVFSYLNKKKVDLLIYFTDGKGEKALMSAPRQYKVLWVLSGSSEQLSLEKPYGIIKKLKKIEIKEEQPDMKDVRNGGYSMNNQEPI